MLVALAVGMDPPMKEVILSKKGNIIISLVVLEHVAKVAIQPIVSMLEEVKILLDLMLMQVGEVSRLLAQEKPMVNW